MIREDLIRALSNPTMKVTDRALLKRMHTERFKEYVEDLTQLLFVSNQALHHACTMAGVAASRHPVFAARMFCGLTAGVLLAQHGVRVERGLGGWT